MASALKITAGATILTIARKAWMSWNTSGWFWQFVPIRFHRNGAASSRSTSTPRLARKNISSTISRNTSGLV